MVLSIAPAKRLLSTLALLATAFIVRGSTVCAQDNKDGATSVPGIVPSPAVHISSDNVSAPHFETFLALNPRDSRNLVAASMVLDSGRIRTVTYTSLDGGETWRQARAASGDSTRPWADPTVHFDESAAAFFTALDSRPGQNGVLSSDRTLILRRSPDGGRTWERSTFIPGFIDRQYVAVDKSTGPYRGRLYVVGKGPAHWPGGPYTAVLRVASSSDTERGFPGSYSLVMPTPADLLYAPTDPVVTPDGTLAVSYWIQEWNIGEGRYAPIDSLEVTRGYIATVVSSDGGVSFSPPYRGPAVNSLQGSRRGLVAQSPPRATVDLSTGERRGRIYLAYNHYDGSRHAIQVVWSDDAGRSWSQPARVSTNTGGGDPSTPAIAVNRHGVVGLVWNDRRHDATNRCYHLYFAASIDGGQSFSRNARLSDASTCPTDPSNAVGVAASAYVHPNPGDATGKSQDVHFTTVPGRWPNGGDTQGLVADREGVFHAAWISGKTGTMQVWAQRVAVDARRLCAAGAIQLSDRVLDEAVLEVGTAKMDTLSRTLTISARLRNTGSAELQGPLHLVLEDASWQVTAVEATNADVGARGAGARWIFPISSGTLKSGQRSDSRLLTWTFVKNPIVAFSGIYSMASFRVIHAQRQALVACT